MGTGKGTCLFLRGLWLRAFLRRVIDGLDQSRSEYPVKYGALGPHLHAGHTAFFHLNSALAQAPGHQQREERTHIGIVSDYHHGFQPAYSAEKVPETLIVRTRMKRRS